MKGPILNYVPEPMPAAEQVKSAETQLHWNKRDLEGVTWAIHPTDLTELRKSIGQATGLLGCFFTVAADPDLAGAGPRLIWPDEWPDSWT